LQYKFDVLFLVLWRRAAFGSHGLRSFALGGEESSGELKNFLCDKLHILN